MKTALLTSYRRDGTPVGTPVTIAVEGSHAFRPHLRQGREDEAHPPQPGGGDRPFNAPGPTHRSIDPGRIRILEGAEADHAARHIARRQPILQGVFVPLYHRLRRYRTIHMDLTPIEHQVRRSA